MGVTCSYSSTPGLGSFSVGVAKCHGSTKLGGGLGSWVVGRRYISCAKKTKNCVNHGTKISIILKRSSFETEFDVIAKCVTTETCPCFPLDAESAYRGVFELQLHFLTVAKFHSVK